MKASDRAVVVGLAIVAMIASFWFLVLSPKREEVATLDDEIATLSAQVDEQRQVALAAEQAKGDFASDYHRLVVLGKAVPEGEDTSSLFVEIDEIAQRSGIAFDAIELKEGPSAPPATGAEQTTTDQAQAAGTGDPAAATTTPTLAPATEAGAAGLPIGAIVGQAGLPTMPYQVKLSGDFFELADFLAGIDRLVASDQARPSVDGRLITIDGFALAGDDDKGLPHLDATMVMTTYVAPADQGLVGGAAPAGPAPAATTPTPTSATAVPAP